MRSHCVRPTTLSRKSTGKGGAGTSRRRPSPPRPAISLMVSTVVDLDPSASVALSIDEYSEAELALLIKWIESDTLLRPKEQLIDEAMRELGFQRRGRKIVAAIEHVIDSTRRHGAL